MPPPAAPCVELRRNICGGLTGERRVCRADAFAMHAMAHRAGLNPARRIAILIQMRTRRIPVASRAPFGAEPRIIERDKRAIFTAQSQRHRPHRLVLPAAAGVIIQLPVQEARVQPGQPGRAGAVALPPDAMAGDARMGRPAIAAAKRDQFARCPERIRRCRLRRGAACQQQQGARKARPGSGNSHIRRNHSPPHRFPEGTVPWETECRAQGKSPSSHCPWDCSPPAMLRRSHHIRCRAPAPNVGVS